jgi:hypothetical protein
MLTWTKKIEKTKYLILLIVLIAAIIRLASVPAFANAPSSPVDVYYVDKQAAKLTLELQNPYVQAIDIQGHGIYPFVYLPMVAVYYIPFYLIGDIRFGNIVADILIILSIYWIAKSINKGAAFFAPLAFALLPFSVWLTSVAATNMMIGTAFLTLSIAALLYKKYLPSAIFLGIALATNQLLALTLPLIIYWFWREHKLSYFFGSLAVTAGIVLPFLITAPSRFIYEVGFFQFDRALQVDGAFSLYSFINLTTGQSIPTWLRIGLFILIALTAVIGLKLKPSLLIPLIGLVLLSGAFILPVNGFLNYYLPGAAFCTTLVPYAIDRIASKMETSKH